MKPPIIQSKSLLGLENTPLQGNTYRPLDYYIQAWEWLLVPPGGLVDTILQGLLASSISAFVVTSPAMIAVTGFVVLGIYILGAFVATVLSRRLTLPFIMRGLSLGIGLLLPLI